MKEIRITQEEEAELAGQIVDVFEDFLESKGVNVENEERDGEESPAIIFGADNKNVRKTHSFKCGMDSTKRKVYIDVKNIHVS